MKNLGLPLAMIEKATDLGLEAIKQLCGDLQSMIKG
jgi:hypothetical protein